MVNPLTYFREVGQELQNVSWPSQTKTLNMTALVIVVSILVAAFIAGSDFIFNQLLTILIS